MDELADGVGSGTAGRDEEEEVAVDVDHLERCAHRCGEGGTAAGAALGGTFDRFVELIDEPLRQGRDERVLVADVAVHDGLAHSGCCGDVVHRDVGPVGSDESESGGEELLAVGHHVAGAGPSRPAPWRNGGSRAGRHGLTVSRQTRDSQAAANFSYSG